MAARNDGTRLELLKAHQELRVILRASEEWGEGYTDAPRAFDRLLKLEAQLEVAVAEYLHQAADRAKGYVDWSRFPEPVQASSEQIHADAGPVANNDDDVWLDEQKLLTAAVLGLITDMIATGAQSGEERFDLPLGFDSLHEAVLEAARTHVAKFVKGATETTRKLIRESVARSMDMGEDINDTTLRIMKVIDSPIRAELIATTESVNAYQNGYYLYARETGAKSKTWDGLAGACNICSPLIGKTVAIDELFELANDKKIPHPAGHPRCRCSLIYNY